MNDLGERVAKIEAKLDFIIDHMSSLPPSPETIRRLDSLESDQRDMQSFLDNFKGKLAVAGAGFMLMGTVITYAINWIINHVTFGSN